MSFAVWALIVGVLLTIMALSGSLMRRLPLSTSMLYLAVGYALGPAAWALFAPDPMAHSVLIERFAEVAVLISLFAAGMKLGLPLADAEWRLPLRLATVSMALTVGLVAAIGMFALGMSPGAAVLLGAILAPTDPVLASDVQVEDATDRDRLRFALTGEGGLNDGAAFPFVMLGLGLLGLHELGTGWIRWLAVDVFWAIGAGLGAGAALGMLVGKLVVYLRIHHKEAVGLDEFLVLGLIALAYGAALLIHAYGFLAVFAAGLALQRVRGQPDPQTVSAVANPLMDKQLQRELATSPEHAPTFMMQSVRGINEQLERIGEVAVVLVLGAMLADAHFTWGALWFVALVLLVARPLSVWLGLLGAPASGQQRVLMAWFGIRGVGSIYYLMYAINHGLPEPLAREMVSLVLVTVAVSIVAHGVSVTPLMNLYAAGRAARPSAGED